MSSQTPIELVNQRLQEDVKRYGKIETYAAKTPLFSPEEMQESFFFVLQGRIKVSQVSLEDGKEQTLHILTSGDMYDVVTLLDGQVHDNILESLDEVKLIRFPMQIVRKWMQEDTHFNQLLYPYIAQQFRQMEDLALDLSFYDTAKRLIKLISKDALRRYQGKTSLIHDLPHEELASLIGTVRKVLNRHLQKLKKDGVIDISRKNIEIKDAEKLLESLPYE